MAGLFIALIVDKCTVCQSHWKSDFRLHRFQKWALLTCPWLRLKRDEKSQAILEHLMTFRSSISTGKLEPLLFLMFFFSVSWSRAYGLCGLSLYTSNDLTYNSIRFKKPLDIFWPANSKKRFRRLFSYDFGSKQKALSDFLASSSTPGSRFKT